MADKPNGVIIPEQLDIKLGQFMKDEPDTVLLTIKSRRAAGFDETPLEFFNYETLYTAEKWMKGCIFPFLVKRRPRNN